MTTQPWFGFQAKERYHGGDPAFYEAEALQWPLLLERNYPTIREEFAQRFGDGSSLDVFFDEKMIERPGTWKTHSLYVHGLRYHQNLKFFPRTDEVLRQIPGLVSASFSFLEPGGSILPHHGDSNLIVRGHLGMSIPAGLPECGFEVNGEQRAWENGRMLLFCDAYEHRAWNHSKRPRLVMIIDVMRPEQLRRADAVCSRVLGSILVYRMEARLRQRLPSWVGFQELPRAARGLTFRALSSAWRGYLPVQRRMPVLPPH